MADSPAFRSGVPQSDGVRTAFLDGSERWVLHLGPTWIGWGRYLPGWRWSEHVRPAHGRESEGHSGYVVSGEMAVLGADGTEHHMRPGEAWWAAPGHDAWVVGSDPCVALDFPTT